MGFIIVSGGFDGDPGSRPLPLRGSLTVTDNIIAVGISGPVLKLDGRGFRNGFVTLTDSSNVTRTAFSSSLGYDRFNRDYALDRLSKAISDLESNL